MRDMPAVKPQRGICLLNIQERKSDSPSPIVKSWLTVTGHWCRREFFSNFHSKIVNVQVRGRRFDPASIKKHVSCTIWGRYGVSAYRWRRREGHGLYMNGRRKAVAHGSARSKIFVLASMPAFDALGLFNITTRTEFESNNIIYLLRLRPSCPDRLVYMCRLHSRAYL